MHHRAPWSKSVTTITLGVIALLGVVGAVSPGWVGMIVWLMVPALALFGPRGFSVTDDAVLVHYLGRSKRIGLGSLKDVRVEPNVTMGSIRTFGNGGVFGFTGFFRNTLLGSYRAYVTDPELAVVLEFEERTVVVSPERPNLFADQVAEMAQIQVVAEA